MWKEGKGEVEDVVVRRMRGDQKGIEVELG